ncbi:MAG: ATP-binding protein [Tissierellaceae bacterium]|nr:ATP-binding protein [Tissierellaceae bacterium]
MTLSKKLIISFIFTIIISISITSFMSNTMINRKFDSYLIEEQKIKFERIRNEINNTFIEKGTTISNEDLAEFAASEGIYIEINDVNNKMLCHSNNKNLLNRGMMGMGNMMRHHMMMNQNGNYVEKTFNLLDGDNIIGNLVIGYIDNSHLTESALIFKDTLSTAFVISGIIAVIVGLIVSVFMSKSLTNPLVHITSTANEMRIGNLSSRSNVQTNTIEVKELSNSINFLAETLEKQEGLRKRYASDIAHELRTPLTTLKSYLEAIIDDVWEPSEEHLSILMEEVNRLTKLVEDLRYTFESSEAHPVLNKTKINISRELENIISTFKPLYLYEKYSLESSIEEDVEVVMDSDKLKQIIVNLLSNAMRYLKDNGKVMVSLSNENNLVKITVEDNGIGIKKEDLPYIFERFYRADISRNKETGGTGLGLSIIKNLVEAHEGNIYVESEFGKGTKFIVELPRGSFIFD